MLTDVPNIGRWFSEPLITGAQASVSSQRVTLTLSAAGGSSWIQAIVIACVIEGRKRRCYDSVFAHSDSSIGGDKSKEGWSERKGGRGEQPVH